MEITVIRERLDKAREQYHKLMMGKATRVIVDQSGERVEYTAVSSANLMAYIRELEGKLGAASRGGRAVGPLRFVW
ncbi:gpW family head-tail joining protein [Paenirhodobacter populi]|nr:gpW family head-tail joining protein [Sinirhodobacter populi]